MDPEGEPALGYDVARRYSSPEKKEQRPDERHSDGDGGERPSTCLPASSSANEMINLWWRLMSPGKEQVLVSPMHTLLSLQVPANASSSNAMMRLEEPPTPHHPPNPTQ